MKRKTQSKVKSIFDPIVQRDVLSKARVANATTCPHRDEEAVVEGLKFIYGFLFVIR